MWGLTVACCYLRITWLWIWLRSATSHSTLHLKCRRIPSLIASFQPTHASVTRCIHEALLNMCVGFFLLLEVYILLCTTCHPHVDHAWPLCIFQAPYTKSQVKLAMYAQKPSFSYAHPFHTLHMCSILLTWLYIMHTHTTLHMHLCI